MAWGIISENASKKEKFWACADGVGFAILFGGKVYG